MARKLSWQETAIAFQTSWDKICHAVEYVVAWGLEHRHLGSIQAIGVDEIQNARGHKYLTLVYQIGQQRSNHGPLENILRNAGPTWWMRCLSSSPLADREPLTSSR